MVEFALLRQTRPFETIITSLRKMTGAKVASRGVNYWLLGLALIGLAIAKVASVYWEMDRRLQKTSFGSEGCTRYRGMMSPEDIIPVFEGVFVGSSDERRTHKTKSIGAEATPWGNLFAIWNVDTPGQDPKTARLELEGFPEGIAFRPHGMHFQRETGELFVINHAYSQGGERIDVFKVSEAFPQDPLPTIHPSLLEATPEPAAPETTQERDAMRPNSKGDSSDNSDPTAAIVDIGVAHDDANDDKTAETAVAGGEGGVVDGDAAGGGGLEGDAGGAGEGEVEVGMESGAEEGGGGEASEESLAMWRDRMQAGGVSDNTPGDQRGAQISKAALETSVTELEEEIKRREDVVESAKERAKRVKRETKEAAVKAKAEARRQQAEAKEAQAKQKAIDKAASARASARAKGLSRGETPVKLTYSFSVEHEYITNNYGGLNDLVMASDDEIYVTQWQAQAHPLHGPTQPDGLVEHLRVFATKAALLLLLKVPPIIRCTGIRGPEISCERLAEGLGVMYNGIALSPNKERLLVSDSASMQMLVFDRSKETGQLTTRQHLDLRGIPDNLEIDLNRAAKGEEAYTVGLLNGWNFLAYSTVMENAKESSDGDNVKVAGGMASLSFDDKFGNYTSSLEMWQDGSLLSISSAVSTPSGSRLLGSAFEDGFLLCRPPPCRPGSGENGDCPVWGGGAPTIGE